MAEKPDRDANGGSHETPSTVEASETHGPHRAPRGLLHRERPEAVTLLIEFFKMSRATAVLLIAFILVAALYMFVRQDPVVAFNSPPRSDSSQTDTSGTDSSSTADPSSSEQATDSVESSDVQPSAEISGTENPIPGQERGMDTGETEGVDQSPQGSTSTQVPPTSTGQSPQPQQQFEQTQVPVS